MDSTAVIEAALRLREIESKNAAQLAALLEVHAQRVAEARDDVDRAILAAVAGNAGDSERLAVPPRKKRPYCRASPLRDRAEEIIQASPGISTDGLATAVYGSADYMNRNKVRALMSASKRVKCHDGLWWEVTP